MKFDEKNFGYLPVKTFLSGFAIAVLFRVLNIEFTTLFLEESASVKNIYAGVSIVSWCLCFYFMTFLRPDEDWLVRKTRALLSVYIKFFMDVSFFALAFVVVFNFFDGEFWSRYGWWCTGFFISLIFMHHLYLILNEEKISTVALVKKIDESLHSANIYEMLKHRDFAGVCGVFFFIVGLSTALHLKFMH